MFKSVYSFSKVAENSTRLKRINNNTRPLYLKKYINFFIMIKVHIRMEGGGGIGSEKKKQELNKNKFSILV